MSGIREASHPSTDKESIMEKIHGFTLTGIIEQAPISKWGVSFAQFTLSSPVPQYP
jgi:hypothetical protein